MINVERTFLVKRPVEVVVNYLKDFANAEQWDPGTKSCTQESSGPIEVGTTWHNVSEIKGKETELAYRLATLDGGHIVFIGENKTATSTDDITVTAAEGGSSIKYHAQIEFHGIAKLAGPFLQSEFEGLGDQTATQITEAIEAL